MHVDMYKYKGGRTSFQPNLTITHVYTVSVGHQADDVNRLEAERCRISPLLPALPRS